MADLASLYLQNKMPYLEEPKFQVTPEDLANMKTSSDAGQKQNWMQTDQGKATIAGAKEGASSGNLGNTLTSAGLYNMLSAGSVTPMGAGLAGAGILLNAYDQGQQVDYNNKKMVAEQQVQAQRNKTAALYQMLGRNYGIS